MMMTFSQRKNVRFMGMQDTGFRIQDSGCRMQDAGFGIPDAGYRKNTGFCEVKVPGLTYR